MNFTDEELRKKLTPEQYKILREKGTEAPFSGQYWNEKSKGMYKCAACGARLFDSDTKFESKAAGLRGWPSFEQAIPGAVEIKPDDSLGMHRTKVVCANCGSHLGHLFENVSEEGGKNHYCINSACLLLEKK